MSSEVLQQLYLTQRALCQDLLAEHICNLLDRNAFLCLGIGGSTMQRVSNMRIEAGWQIRVLTRQYHKLLVQALW